MDTGRDSERQSGVAAGREGVAGRGRWRGCGPPPSGGADTLRREQWRRLDVGRRLPARLQSVPAGSARGLLQSSEPGGQGGTATPAERLPPVHRDGAGVPVRPPGPRGPGHPEGLGRHPILGRPGGRRAAGEAVGTGAGARGGRGPGTQARTGGRAGGSPLTCGSQSLAR